MQLEGINLRLLNLTEAAKRIGVSKRTVQRLVKDGHLPRPKRVGGHPRWFAHDVELYLCRVYVGMIDGEAGSDSSIAATEPQKTSRR